jgi:hypothetical protein
MKLFKRLSNVNQSKQLILCEGVNTLVHVYEQVCRTPSEGKSSVNPPPLGIIRQTKESQKSQEKGKSENFVIFPKVGNFKFFQKPQTILPQHGAIA